ncbi:MULTISPECIES: group 1 truncated hemoglobin [unclassified Microcella]|uniref:group I truncated hemoglobin n=1 Tax=unclassified Microcella TaxID=2630066 RepID=UPI0006F81DB5|nr:MULTISPECIES: group 1 truncated hemoglobin [unclassified Microcella]KQV26085.1 hypothetical protein ASC54_03895 [Yonghaparkia sp. Root332]KRF33111.1 hypothetical protein ASG83_03760 [Yonghaparkia sp. Soil809]
MPLIRRLGGDEGVAALVDQLSARVKADPLMGPYFRDVDEAALNRHRSMFLSALLGGQHSYTGKTVAEAHGPFRLGDAEFDAFLRVMRETLEAADVPAVDRRTVLRRLSRLRADIVSRGVSVAPGAPVFGGPESSG